MKVYLERFGVDNRKGSSRYLLDEDSGTISEEVLDTDDWMLGCCGIGRYITTGIFKQKIIFVGIYLRDRSVVFRFGSDSIEISKDWSVVRRDIGWILPLCRVQIYKGDAALYRSFVYWSAEGFFPRIDIIEYFAEMLAEPTGLKSFIYSYSALNLGQMRPLLPNGLTPEYLNSIEDPYQV